jgi:hypothetical protein
MRHSCGVRIVDISVDKSHLALVDDAGDLAVYSDDFTTPKYKIPKVCSVAFHSTSTDFLAFSHVDSSVAILHLYDMSKYDQSARGHVAGFHDNCVIVFDKDSVRMPSASFPHPRMSGKRTTGAVVAPAITSHRDTIHYSDQVKLTTSQEP